MAYLSEDDNCIDLESYNKKFEFEWNNIVEKNKKPIESKYKICYPLKTKCFVKGPEKIFSIPYSPIYTVPSAKTKNKWLVEKQDTDRLLYNKVEDICNLYLQHRYVLYMDCSTLKTLKEYELINIQYNEYQLSGKYIDLEKARCKGLSDQIWINTNSKYSDHYSGHFTFSYTFKYYISKEEWEYFSSSPFLSVIYKSICEEIHKAYYMFYVIIVFALDSNRYPYIEVLISNRTKRTINMNVCLSKDDSNMSYNTDKLMNCFNAGIKVGRDTVIDIINQHNGVYDYSLANDPEYFRKYASPTIGDLNLGLNISTEEY